MTKAVTTRTANARLKERSGVCECMWIVVVVVFVGHSLVGLRGVATIYHDVPPNNYRGARALHNNQLRHEGSDDSSDCENRWLSFECIEPSECWRLGTDGSTISSLDD